MPKCQRRIRQPPFQRLRNPRKCEVDAPFFHSQTGGLLPHLFGRGHSFLNSDVERTYGKGVFSKIRQPIPEVSSGLVHLRRRPATEIISSCFSSGNGHTASMERPCPVCSETSVTELANSLTNATHATAQCDKCGAVFNYLISKPNQGACCPPSNGTGSQNPED